MICLFTECLIRARQSVRSWESNGEQNRHGPSPHGLSPFVQTHSNHSFLLIYHKARFLLLAITFQFRRPCIKANWFYASAEKSMKKHFLALCRLGSILFLHHICICISMDTYISMPNVCIYYKYAICN